jgi:predicted nuclease with TOPRIM domain
MTNKPLAEIRYELAQAAIANAKNMDDLFQQGFDSALTELSKRGSLVDIKDVTNELREQFGTANVSATEACEWMLGIIRPEYTALEEKIAALESELAKQKEFRIAMMETMNDTEKECARLREALKEIFPPEVLMCVGPGVTYEMSAMVKDFNGYLHKRYWPEIDKIISEALSGREEGGE